MSPEAVKSPRAGSLASKVTEIIPGAKLVEVRPAAGGRLGAQPSARAAGAEPPSSNTGVLVTTRTGQEVFFDWLGASMHEEPEALQAILSQWLPGEWYRADRGTMYYEDRWMGPAGAQVLARNRGGSDETHVELPGKWMGSVSPEAQVDAVLWAWQKGKLSRLDVAMDDFDKVVMPQALRDEVFAGNVVTKVADPLFHELCASRAATMEFGKRGGLRMLRVYDKDKESKGEIPSVRWELQLRNEAAHEFARRVLIGERVGAGRVEIREDALPEEFKAELVSLVDFRDRCVDVNVTRCPRLPWFSRLVGEVAKVRRVVVAVARSVDRVKAWMMRQVAASLAVVVEAEGGDLGFAEQLVRAGRRRFKEKHHAMLWEAGLFAPAAAKVAGLG